MFFIDVHSEYQRGLDFKRVRALGYRAAIIKATQGTGYVPGGVKDFTAGAQRAGLTLGFYHFLDDSNGDRQALHFVETVKSLGGAHGRLLVVDFEAHPNPSQTATNRALHDFVSGVKKRTNGHAILLYSGYGFWTSGDPSGNARDYGVDAIWDARYPDMAQHKYPRAYYRRVKGWYRDQARWGGMAPAAWQFTSAGRVAGQYIDCDKFFGSKDDLLKLTTKAASRPKPEPTVTNTDKALAYGLRLVGAPYHWWTSTGTSLGEGPPAWAEDSPPPDPSRVKEKGVFCAGVGNLMRRAIGKPVPKNPPYNGGTGAWAKLPKQSFKLSELRRGDVLFRPYASVQDQGHWAVALGGADDGILQSFATSMGTVYPGVNTRYTARQSHDNGYYKYRIKREDVWG